MILLCTYRIKLFTYLNFYFKKNYTRLFFRKYVLSGFIEYTNYVGTIRPFFEGSEI